MYLEDVVRIKYIGVAIRSENFAEGVLAFEMKGVGFLFQIVGFVSSGTAGSNRLATNRN